MSRIHEALKKAEQERNATLASPLAEGAESAVVPSNLPVAGRPDALSFELLRESVPRTAWNLDPRIMVFGNTRTSERAAIPGSEEFRTLRSRLYQIRERQPLHTVLITSALPAEGKTFVAANLAHCIVKQHERRALLIDADLRWSRLHLSLGAPAKPGLADYLTGDAELFDVIQRGPFENLYFIPGGKPSANPAELISSGRLKDLLQRLTPLFDWVILDSPPAVPVADASLLADICDGVLMVVRSAITPFDMAQKAVQEFREKHLLGVVLNDVEAREGYTSYYYHYYHGHESKNGKSKG